MRRLGLTALLLLALAEPAAAEIVATPGPHNGRVLADGPELTNGVLTWMTTECVWGCGLDDDETGRRFRVRARQPEGKSVEIARGRIERGGSGPNYWIEAIRFSASDTHLALVRDDFGSTEDGGDYMGVALRAGAFGGPLTQFLRCDTYDFDTEPRALVEGTRLVYDPAPCDGEGTVAVRDIDSGAEWQLAEAGRDIRPLDMEGRYLAVAVSEPPSAGRLRVLDAGTRAPLYEFAAPPALVAADVAADGSVATLTGVTGPGCDRELTRYSGSGEARDRHAACELVAHGGDRTLFVAPDEPGRGIWELRGGESAPRKLLELWQIPLLGADSDGSQIAWAVPTCAGGQAMHLDDLDTSHLDAGPPYCVGGFLLGRLLVDAAGRANAVLRCPDGCNGTLTVHVGGRIAARRRYAISNGHTPVRVRVAPWVRRRLMAGPLRARGRVVVEHLDGTHHVGARPLRIVRRR